MKNILICGNYGASNLGDEAILAGTIKQLQRQHPKATLAALSYNPTQTAAEHHIKAYYFLPFGVRSFFRGIFQGQLFRTLQAIKNCNLFILGGGGLFSNESWQAIAIWILHAKTAYFFRKPLHIHAQTIDWIESNFWRQSVKKILAQASQISVRDQESQSVLEKLGIKSSKVVKDPAWELATEINRRPQIKKRIAISLRPWHDQTPHLINTLAETLPEFATNFEFLLIPFQSIKSGDHQVLESLSQKLSTKGIRHQIANPKNFRQALDLVNESHGIIAMRLHACIFAAICHKQCVSIAYLPKVSSFAKTKWPGLALDISEITTQNLSDKIRKMIQSA